MSSPTATAREIPLVHTAPGSPVHDLLASTCNEESDELARAMWGDFRTELLPTLESLGSLADATALKAHLHSIRGTSAQFGLFLLEVFLFAWEKKEPDPLGAREHYLPGALVIARLSLDAIENDLPHLRSLPA